MKINNPPKLLSLVIPAFNEEEAIPQLRYAVEEWSSKLDFSVEVIVVNDGSCDHTYELLADWALADSRIRILSFSRNFGHQAAVTAGMELSRGEVVVILDADLQDPLDVIPQMLVKYLEGYDVVFGQRISRGGETLFKRITAWAFYRLMRLLVHKGLPYDTGDFRLVSRRCLDAVLRMNEVHRFLRGMFAWTGFQQIALKYHRHPRKYGQTKYPLRKMLKFAWDAALSFSIIPIKLISLSGIATATFGFCYAIYSTYHAMVLKDTVPGWTTLIVLFALTGGMILIGLGVLGEYIGRIYEELKKRPLYIVQDKINVD